MSTFSDGSQWDGIAALQAVLTPPGDDALGVAYTGMTTRVSEFLDALAGASLTRPAIAEVSAALDGLLPQLRARSVDERRRMWGRWATLPGRGQALVPAIDVLDLTADAVRATVRFGRFHGGENGVVHGGAVTLLLDDAAGWLCLWTDAPPVRTAYLNTSFRAPAPVGRDLQLEAAVQRVEGRKRVVRLTLSVDGRLCTEAEALMVTLLAGQA